MARASYIYILTTKGGSDPAHAFTVKHELLTHMRRYGGLEGRNVFRLSDNGRAGDGGVWSWPATQYLEENG